MTDPDQASERAAGPGPDWGVGCYERTAERLLPAAEVLLDAAAVRPGERVLDVGCGTGNAALLAAAAGARVTGVDPARRLLDVARARAERERLSCVFELGTAEALPAQDHSVDCLLSSFGVVFARHPETAAAEIARVVDLGGRAAFTAWLPGGGVAALATRAQELVLSAVGAPPPPPGFGWHDEQLVSELLSPHGMRAAVAGRHGIAFTGPSPEAFLDAELASHPLAVSGFSVLERAGRAEQARTELLDVLSQHNEEPRGFRSTSRYVVLVCRRG